MVFRDRERRATGGLQEDYGAGRNPLPPSASDLTASCRTVPTSAEDPSMKWIAAQTKWIMLISGILTTTILLYVIAPNYAAKSGFGQTLDGPLADLMARSWGMMVGLFGVMLIYAACQDAGCGVGPPRFLWGAALCFCPLPGREKVFWGFPPPPHRPEEAHYD